MKYPLSPTLLNAVLQLLLISCAMASQRKIRRKPTNSVTIRQSASANGLCVGHLTGEFVKHPEDCQMMYLCMDGEAVLASCPPNMLFNPESKLCDQAANVECTFGNDDDTGVQSPPDNELDNMVTDVFTYCARLTQQQSSDRIVYIGSSSSCAHYYICYYGQAILQECSSELQWNAVTGKCDIPERAQCTLQQPVTPPTNNNNNNGSGSSSNSNEFIHCPAYGQHLFPHMQRCEFFIYCVKGHATLQQCPFYYFFDVVSKSCQWSRTAVCVRDLNLPRHSQ